MKICVILFVVLTFTTSFSDSRYSRKIHNKKDHHFKLRNTQKFANQKILQPRPNGRAATGRSLPQHTQSKLNHVRPVRINNGRTSQFSKGNQVNVKPAPTKRLPRQPVLSRQAQAHPVQRPVHLQDNRWSPIGFRDKYGRKKKPIYPPKKKYTQPKDIKKTKAVPKDFERVDKSHLNNFRSQIYHQHQQQQQHQQQKQTTTPQNLNLGSFSEVNGIKIYKFSGNDGRGIYNQDQRTRFQPHNEVEVTQSPFKWSQAFVSSEPQSNRRVEEDTKTYYEYTHNKAYDDYPQNNKGVTTAPLPPPFPTIHTTPQPYTLGPVVIISGSRVDQNK